MLAWLWSKPTAVRGAFGCLVGTSLLFLRGGQLKDQQVSVLAVLNNNGAETIPIMHIRMLVADSSSTQEDQSQLAWSALFQPDQA